MKLQNEVGSIKMNRWDKRWLIIKGTYGMPQEFINIGIHPTQWDIRIPIRNHVVGIQYETTE